MSSLFQCYWLLILTRCGRKFSSYCSSKLSHVVLGLGLFLGGCAQNYVGVTHGIYEQFLQGHYKEAAEAWQQHMGDSSKDRLLYLLDAAVAFHHAGSYQESNKLFFEADKLAEWSDYTSLSEETLSILTTDLVIPYKGENFEKVLIHQYLALNYLFLGSLEEALVEARRVNRMLHMLKMEQDRDRILDPLAYYMSALAYEMDANWNDALIDYKSVLKLLGKNPDLLWQLCKTAVLSGLQEDYEKYFSQLKTVDHDSALARVQKSDWKRWAQNHEVVLILEQGLSPEKVPHAQFSMIPVYQSRFHPISYTRVTWKGPSEEDSFDGESRVLYDIDQVAKVTLDQKYAGIIAKRVAAAAIREGAAMTVDRKVSPLAGAFLRLGLYALDEADTRFWQTLPKTFQVVRIPLRPGLRSKMTDLLIHLEYLDESHHSLGQSREVKVVLDPHHSKTLQVLRI